MCRFKGLKRISACIMIFVMAVVLITGCSGDQANVSTENGSSTETEESSDQNAASGNESQENAAMGRYVETIMDLTDCWQTKGLYRLPDDGLLIPDASVGLFMSADKGTTWEVKDEEWFAKIAKEGLFVPSVAVGADGTKAVLYDNDKDNGDIHTVGLIEKPDGTQIPFEISLTEEDWLNRIWVSDTGRVFTSSFDGTIYEVMEDGSSEKFLTIDRRPIQIEFVGNLMVIDGSRFDGLLLYDIEKETYVEDEVLYDFVNENYKNRDYSTEDCYSIKFFPGEDNVLYLAGEKGLHRHVIGGSVMEQVIDGNLSCLSNPSFLLKGMIALPDNEFLGLFADNKLVRFTYDPDIPTVPNDKLKIYSLKENDMLRQAITIFQLENPEIFVMYEIGMGENSSITKDDALKKLNTQIMAGEGPDLLLLDDMPIDSYIEKGMLLDLSDCLNSMEEESKPFENIINSFKLEDKVYMIPCEMQLSIIVGREKYVSKAKDLESVADMMEEIRKDNPEEDILGISSEKGIMRLFSMISEPSWKTEEGGIDKDAIENFLQQTKRIFDAQTDGIPDEVMEAYESKQESFLEYYGYRYDESDYIRNTSWAEILGNYCQVQCGAVKWRSDLTTSFSLSKVKGFEDVVLMPLNEGDQTIFIPQSLIGINAASSEIEKAEKMLKVLFGKENQTSLYNGLPVNQTGIEDGTLTLKNASTLSEDGIYQSFGISNEDGEYLSLADYWFDEEQKQFIRDWVRTVDTPYVKDEVLEDAVYSEGIRYMRGEQSLQEAVDAIEQKVSIYMSE
ncbi:MAG: ABC transporter substrate-binding protein [Lachnospiraceae bacterium]|nr:ABC transporter substrate-binding protein [Lachnospiraceae bacterium]